MLGASLLGKTLAWCPIPDPPNAWGFLLGDEPMAELVWPTRGGVVRAEAGDEVLRLSFSGVVIVHGILRGQSEEAQALFAGSFRRGRARTADGRDFVLFSSIDRAIGPWVGFNDTEGAGVLRIRGRAGSGQIWSEVSVTPDASYRSVVSSLLLLWGGLQLLRLRRPWLGASTVAVSGRAARRGLDLLATGVAF